MWHYLINGQQHGPMDDLAFDQLIASGAVTDDTFVWKEGLSEWMQLRQTRTLNNTGTPVEDAGSSTCTMCGKSVGSDNLIDLLGLRVCAACKPMAVQTLREGVTPTGNISASRDGKKVMTYNQKSLPPRCYKCNHAIVEPPMKRKLYWHPVGYYLLILVNVILYAVVAMVVRKRASVELYLCAQHSKRRKYFIIGGWSGTALGIAMLIVGISEDIGVLTAIGFLVIFLAILVGLRGASLTRATRIKGDTVWLSGAGKEFLASLPERS